MIGQKPTKYEYDGSSFFFSPRSASKSGVSCRPAIIQPLESSPSAGQLWHGAARLNVILVAHNFPSNGKSSRRQRTESSITQMTTILMIKIENAFSLQAKFSYKSFSNCSWNLFYDKAQKTEIRHLFLQMQSLLEEIQFHFKNAWKKIVHAGPLKVRSISFLVVHPSKLASIKNLIQIGWKADNDNTSGSLAMPAIDQS